MEIRTPNTQAEWDAYYQLRWEVLRKPWNQPVGSEKDVDENAFYHVAAFEDEKIIGVGCFKMINSQEVQVRFMAVANSIQRKGVGVILMNALEVEAFGRGVTKVVLHAREIAVAFYEYCGYTMIEKSYLLYDSIQHYLMSKEI
jgi:N-acetylglutamate synthase-like GNAT family acetyltransferase